MKLTHQTAVAATLESDEDITVTYASHDRHGTPRTYPVGIKDAGTKEIMLTSQSAEELAEALLEVVKCTRESRPS